MMIASKARLLSIESVQIIRLPFFGDENGDLTVIEGMGMIPFSIARVFIVRASSGDLRGQHAHRACSQLMTCSSGAVEVFCDDGNRTANYMLDRPDIGLFVPAGIWAQETYKQDNSVLTVLCDYPYDPGDYINSIEAFYAYRKEAKYG